MAFYHVPVLLKETITMLNCQPDGIYVDCTLGGGGHAREIAKRLGPGGILIGIDQDAAAVAAGTAALAEAVCAVKIVRANFRDLKVILSSLGIIKVDGIVFDLGVSSHQLDMAERGFSYQQDAPLDMRMDPAAPVTARELVNTLGADALARIISDYGEERWARRIANFIVGARRSQPIETTGQLVEIIKAAIPAAARRDGPHPAKRTFQALRIAVNDELNILGQAMRDAVDVLSPGGRLCVITFHSLEDRIAKQTFSDLARDCVCPRELPVCVCKRQPLIRVVGKPIVPAPEEIEANPRARSARLRVAERR